MTVGEGAPTPLPETDVVGSSQGGPRVGPLPLSLPPESKGPGIRRGPSSLPRVIGQSPTSFANGEGPGPD